MPANVGGLSFTGEQVVNTGLNPCCWRVAGLLELVRRFARRMMGNHGGRPSLDQCFFYTPGLASAVEVSAMLRGQREEEDRGQVSSTEPLELVSMMATLISRSAMWVPGTQPRTAGVNPRIGLESLGRWTPSWIFNTCASSTYPSLFPSFFPSQQANFKLQSQL